MIILCILVEQIWQQYVEHDASKCLYRSSSKNDFYESKPRKFSVHTQKKIKLTLKNLTTLRKFTKLLCAETPSYLDPPCDLSLPIKNLM